MTSNSLKAIYRPARNAIRRALRLRIKIAKRNQLVSDWVVPATQPLLWVCQLPRSGGTMLNRLFDGHPEVHVLPRAIGLKNDGRWPGDPAKEIQMLSNAYSLTSYVGRGSVKRASNLHQPATPIYFDERWFQQILRDRSSDAPRDVFDAIHTATFNAWRNCQNLYGIKRYVMMHSIPKPNQFLGQALTDFKTTYPDGWLIFIARNPADWLASCLGLKKRSRPFDSIEQGLTQYIERFRRLAQSPGDQLLVLEFDQLVKYPELSLRAVCEKIGITYSPSMNCTTMNGIPLPQNSTHGTEPEFAPDPSVIGHGASLMPELVHSPQFAEAESLYLQALKRIINTRSAPDKSGNFDQPEPSANPARNDGAELHHVSQAPSHDS